MDEGIPPDLVTLAKMCMLVFPKANEMMARYGRGELTYEEAARELVALYPQLGYLLEGMPLQ